MTTETRTPETGTPAAGPQLLSADRYARARRFLIESARPLEAALFRYRFEGGPMEDVYAALAPYQNPDGGFGHAMEPDVRSPRSSVLATTTALQHLRLLHTPAQHPMAAAAVAYLLTAYDTGLSSWPLVTAAIYDAPHAPWWKQEGLAARFNDFAVNPRAEVLGYLFEFAEESDASALTLRDQLAAPVIKDLLARSGGLSNNDFHCCMRLAESPGLPAAAAVELQRWLLRMAADVVAVDPGAWGGYVLQPLQVAPQRSAPLGIALAHILPQNLDYTIESQGEDGSWSPPWSWFGEYDDAWPQAQNDWRGVLTLERLEWLRAYDRIEQ